MKRIMTLLLGVATSVGASFPSLTMNNNTDIPREISTNISKNQVSNNLIINGKTVNIGEIGVAINNGNVMVPLKVTAESLGFKVTAGSDNKTIVLDNDKIKTEIEVGVDCYFYQSSHAIGMTAPQKFGAAPILIDDVVYVPIKIYNLLFNDKNAVGSFSCETKDGKLIHVNSDSYIVSSLSESEVIGMPNPIQEFSTIEEAQKTLKFKVVVPKEIPSDYKVNFISTVSKELFQIGYSNGQNDILFRMGQGVEKVDGDYNQYKANVTIQVDGKEVNLKGNDSLVNLATWKDNDVSYSISITNGMEKDDVIKMIKSIF